MTSIQDKIRGSLIGGAIGDALGYSVEFLSYRSIVSRYGENGITSYELSRKSKKALISDDTQMTLFTANGLLNNSTKYRQSNGEPIKEIYKAYLDWYGCQYGDFVQSPVTWLCGVEELNSARAPGNTCMSALESGKMGSVAIPINRSKGCGGVMRVAPVGLFYDGSADIKDIMNIASEASAITHGHPLGYIPSASLAHIVHRIVYGGCTLGNTLEDIINESLQIVTKMYSGAFQKEYVEYFIEIINKAVDFSGNDLSDVENIHTLGGGWVAEEALAIAVYCCLKYRDNFDKAIIASVNHSGDSDSTGAIMGNMLGALIGYEGISEKWKNNLELHDVILEVADDLYTKYSDEASWRKKYF